MTISLGFILKIGLFILLALFYVVAMKIMSRRPAPRQPLSDAEILTRTAWQQGASEYDLFRHAAKAWKIPDRQVDEDFRNYLVRHRMPHYVRDFVRKTRASNPMDPPDTP
jgi:hypothetical protein